MSNKTKHFQIFSLWRVFLNDLCWTETVDQACVLCWRGVCASFPKIHLQQQLAFWPPACIFICFLCERNTIWSEEEGLKCVCLCANVCVFPRGPALQQRAIRRQAPLPAAPSGGCERTKGGLRRVFERPYGFRILLWFTSHFDGLT